MKLILPRSFMSHRAFISDKMDHFNAISLWNCRSLRAARSIHRNFSDESDKCHVERKFSFSFNGLELQKDTCERVSKKYIGMTHAIRPLAVINTPSKKPPRGVTREQSYLILLFA